MTESAGVSDEMRGKGGSTIDVPPREYERGRRGRRLIQMQRDAKYREFFPDLWDDAFCCCIDIVIGRSTEEGPSHVIDSGCI